MSPGEGFQEATFRAAQRTRDTAGLPFEIVLASGVVVRVPPSFDATALTRLLEVLTQARAC